MVLPHAAKERRVNYYQKRTTGPNASTKHGGHKDPAFRKPNLHRVNPVEPTERRVTRQMAKASAIPVPAAAPACPPVVPKTIEVRSDPAEVAYKPSGGMHHVNVVNESAERWAFKVKCSDNQLYRVNPVYGVVEPGQSVKVDILRQNGSAKVDKLVILTGKAGTYTDGKEAFAKSSPPEQLVLVVKLVAEA